MINIFNCVKSKNSLCCTLKGAKSLLENGKNISGSVCIYHLYDDKDFLSFLLHELNYATEIQPGYIIFEDEFRSAVLRFWQNP